jgi:hypothetical protein
MTSTWVQRDRERQWVVQKNWSKGFKCRARTFPSKHRDLLSKGQNFEGVIAATAKANVDGGAE